MAGSLQDQLLKAGLADPDKAKKVAREKRKEARVARRAGVDLANEHSEAARQAQAEKTLRDRELNLALSDKARRKAINAQIGQLIETNKLDRGRGEIGFNFTDGRRVKSLYVTALQQRQLSAGRLSIVKLGDRYEIVPRPVADKIAERDRDRVITHEENPETALTEEEQEWYKDYEIPDDLMW